MKFFSITLLLLSFGLKANIRTGIARIEAPFEGSHHHQVLAYHGGRILEVDSRNKEILETLELAQNSELKVELKLEENEITAAHLLAPELSNISRTSQKYHNSFIPPYRPTNLNSMAMAERMFNSLLDKTRWFTECFNRAHIWNRQMDKDFGVKSEKIFIFYTRKYRNYDRNWKWWFHVAPMVRVNGEEVVLDREFARGPLSQYEWEKKFNEPMRNFGKRCKRMSKINTYYSKANQKNEYCNIQIAPMYYWEPSDLKALENEGAIKNRWINSEIKSAASEAFRSWRSVFEEYKVP